MLSFLVACNTAREHQPNSSTLAAPAAAEDAPVPFVQQIAGTALELRMQPVTLSDGRTLWFSATEIPWEVFDAFLFKLDLPAGGEADAYTRPSKPYVTVDRGFGHQGFPALSLNHTAAQAFCTWMSGKSGRTWRLPTMAEWIEAARDAPSGAWATGDDPAALDAVAWYFANSDAKTHAVGRKAPNAHGLYDMHGNVCEWVLDEQGRAVLIGGSYRDQPDSLRFDKPKLPTPAWNASDPQLPKSRWWLADAGWAGMRVLCE